MNERVEKTIWTLLGVVAIALTVATVHLYRLSRTLAPALELPPYRIAYVSFSETTGIPQLYTVDLRSGEVEPLVVSRVGDVLPVAELGAAPTEAPRIAFIRFTSEPGSETGTQIGAPGGVYVVSSGGGPERRVSGNVPRLLPVAPAWSPDGRQLAFAAVEDLNGDGKYVSEEAGIYLSNVDSGEVKRVATVHATGLRLDWSPASAQLILEVRTAQAPVPLAHLLDLQTGELVARDLATTLGCWSPDGRYIAAYSIVDRSIHVLSMAGTELWAVEAPPGEPTDLHWLPTTSPEGEDEGHLLVTCVPERGSGGSRLYLSSALIPRGEPPTWRPLTGEEADASFVSPSPDGRWVVFTQTVGEDTQLQADLYLLNLAQGEPQRLTQEPGYEGQATWVPLRGR